MCSRYILVNTFEQIRKRFELPLETIEVTPNYNISAGQYANMDIPVILTPHSGHIDPPTGSWFLRT